METNILFIVSYHFEDDACQYDKVFSIWIQWIQDFGDGLPTVST